MPIMKNLETNLSDFVTIYPYKEIEDKDWYYTLQDGERVPGIGFDWKEVGFVVKRPDSALITWVRRNALQYYTPKGSKLNVPDFNPAFVKNITGFKVSKRLVENWVNVNELDGRDNEVPLAYNPEWLHDLFTGHAGRFLSVWFMNSYRALMDTVAEDEQEENDDE